MIVVNLKGGLGNQMFEYAIGRTMSLRYNTELLLDTVELEDKTQKHTYRNFELNHFNVKFNTRNGKFPDVVKQYDSIFHILLSRFLKRKGLKYVSEKEFKFIHDVLKAGDNTYLNGYWNSPKYFEGYEDIIRTDFKFITPLSHENIEIAEKIKSNYSVSLHVRRGDYSSNTITNSYHGLCSIEYYKKAIQYVQTKNNNVVFFIFSDDPGWVKEHLKIESPYFVVSKPQALSGIQDMHLMSLCKSAIIANSTFSWWAAWLIENKEKIVIAPLKWFNDSTIITDDLFPRKWIKL